MFLFEFFVASTVRAHAQHMYTPNVHVLCVCIFYLETCTYMCVWYNSLYYISRWRDTQWLFVSKFAELNCEAHSSNSVVVPPVSALPSQQRQSRRSSQRCIFSRREFKALCLTDREKKRRKKTPVSFVGQRKCFKSQGLILMS